MQYDRNDTYLERGRFRVRGDTIEVHPAYEQTILRIELFGDEIERITEVDPTTGEQIRSLDDLWIYPATHYVAGDERMQAAIVRIEAELAERLQHFEKEGKLLEAQRLRMRTQYDLEMMQEVGFCNGIENYSAPIDGRGRGRRRRTRCSTSSPTTSCWSSTRATWRSRSSTASTRATAAARSS